MKTILSLCFCFAYVALSYGNYIPPNYLYYHDNPVADISEESQELDVQDNYIPEEDFPFTAAQNEGILVRHKRQSRDQALGLALSHQDRNGNDRPVGRIHGTASLNAVGNDRNNFHAHGGIGAGSVLFRSKDRRHSIGAGVHASQGRGRYQGFSYKTKPDVGVGLGYRFRF